MVCDMFVACIICSFYPILLTVLIWIVVIALCYPEYRREYPKPRKLCYTTDMTLTGLIGSHDATNCLGVPQIS